MSVAELGPYDNMLAFHGRQTTGYDVADERTGIVRETFDIPEEHLAVILDLPAPKHVQAYATGRTLIEGNNGDGGCKAGMEGVTGVVADNPEASANNFSLHQELVQNILYVPLAGGNANNFALSALGLYAREPQRLGQAPDLRVGYHRPLLFSVTDERGDIIRYGCAPTCVGLGGSALVAAALDGQKPALKELSKKRLGNERRVLKELGITTATLVQAEPFSAEVTINVGTEPLRESFDALTGIEVVGSRIYAKEGRTQVNVDDPNQQVVISRHYAPQPAQLAGLLAMSARLKTGIHPAKRRLDLTDLQMTIRPTSDHAVPFHVEGETGSSYQPEPERKFQLEPGQMLHLSLARIAVPVLMKM